MSQFPGQPGTHRPAKVTLREGAGGEADAATLLDPANQSLADALRITFYLLQVAMIVIFALFLLSGFQSVREGERGVRLLFGKNVEDDLQPGFRFSFPYPLGELIRVTTAPPPVEIDSAFWPRLTDDQKRVARDQLGSIKFTLKPGEDGSLITGDRNLAHTQWTVSYRREQLSHVVRNILDADEKDIVKSAVQAAVVRAIADTSIDDLLKQSGEESGSIAQRVRTLAQAKLDRIQSGLLLDRVVMAEKSPPFQVYGDFTRVQGAQSNAQKELNLADTEAQNQLNEMAGAAHDELTRLIDAYERAIEANDAEAQPRCLDSIFAIFDGRPTTIDGAAVEDSVSGQVVAIINEARQYRSSIVSQRRAELGAYQAKLVQFKVNPGVVVQRELADALAVFLARDNVEKFFLPPGTSALEVLLNPDPIARRAIDKAIRERENEELERERIRRQNEDRYKTDTGKSTVSG